MKTILEEAGELVAMEIGDTMSGSFFIGTGRIDETEYFFAYVKPTGEPWMKRIKALAETARIYEVDTTPRYEAWTHPRHWSIWYKFYIPEDAIIPNFDMMKASQQ